MPGEGLINCPDCKHAFGRWRMRCPACGASNLQRQSLSDAVNSFYAKDRPTDARVKPKAVREKTRAADECIFCRRRGAVALCQTCYEPIHERCMNVHAPGCSQMQRDIATETPKLETA